jgi:hypothetical protein
MHVEERSGSVMIHTLSSPARIRYLLRMRKPARIERFAMNCREYWSRDTSTYLIGSLEAVEAARAQRYESRTTKSPELIFSALLDDHGAREVRFGRALCT